MQCPICASAELQLTPGERKLGEFFVRPDTLACPNCNAIAEQLSGDRLHFTRIPSPYASPIGSLLDRPVPVHEAQHVGHIKAEAVF